MTIIVAEDQMSLAIGKKGQNVRLAAKLVKWKVDIKGPSEALEMGEQPDFIVSNKESDVDFLEDIKNAKGLGEKVMTILFNNNIVTFKEALSRGAKGLLELPGIGPKKATGLIELAEKIQERIAAAQILKTEVETPEAPSTEQSDDVTEKDQKKIEELEESISTNEEAPEDEEISIQELSSLQSEILDILKANGFETLAELSVTPLEELIAIEELDEILGKEILESVKRQLKNAENV